MNTGKKRYITGKFFITLLLNIIFLLSLNAQEKIVFGLTGTVYKGDLKVFNTWKDYLQKEINIPVEIKFSRTYSEMVSMIQRGEVDIAYVCNTTYVKLKNKNIAKLLAIPQSKNKDFYYSYIIARKGKTYNDLFDFRDKLFAFTDPESNSGAIAPSYKLLKKGIKAHFFFSKIIYTYEHSESINAVLESFVDGASVDSLVYEQFIKKHPNKSKNIYIVEKLGPFPMSPLVSSTLLDENIYKKIQNSLINMHEDEKGRDIFMQLSLSKLRLPKNEDYSDIENIIKFIEKY